MTIALESMAVAMPTVKGHPNRAAFRGVLTIVDVPSQKPPSGSKGHRVVLTRAAAEAALPSLLGMALDYAPTFDRHDVRRKVGVITSAELVGRDLEVGGYLYAKDFPEIVDEIGKLGRRKTEVTNRTSLVGLEGMARLTEGARLRASLAAAVEKIRGLTDAIRGTTKRDPESQGFEAAASGGAGLGMSYEVTDVRLADERARVWILTRVVFTGAAVLRKDKAAYQETWIELSS